MTSTDIVRASHPAPGGALSLGTMTPHDAWLFAESLARTPLLPDAYRNNPSSVLWALEYGRALGLDVVTTITTIHVIKGKPTQSADLMLGRALTAGHRVRIKPERHRCVVSIVRCDDPENETVIEWTLDDAVTAGLCEIRNDKPWSRSQKGEPQSWEKYPRAMLRSRAIAEAVRTVCPEVLHGAIYTPEELGAVVDQEGQVVEAPAGPIRMMDHVEVQRVEPETASPASAPSPAPEVSPQAQGIADLAAKATHRGEARPYWSTGKTGRLLEAPIIAPDTKELDQLGGYLTRRLKELPDAPPVVDEDGIPDAEVLPDEPVDPHAAAAKALRAAAAAAGMSDAELDGGFFSATGLPIDEASIREIESWTATLRQSVGAA